MRDNNEIKGWLRWEPVTALLLIILFVVVVIGAVWLRQRMTTYDHIFVVSALLGMPLWIYLMRVSINYPLIWENISDQPKRPLIEKATPRQQVESNKGSFSGRVDNLKEKASQPVSEKDLLNIIINAMKETNISYISDESAGVLARVIGQSGISKLKILELAKKHFQNKFEYCGEICYTPFSQSLGA